MKINEEVKQLPKVNKVNLIDDSSSDDDKNYFEDVGVNDNKEE